MLLRLIAMSRQLTKTIGSRATPSITASSQYTILEGRTPPGTVREEYHRRGMGVWGWGFGFGRWGGGSRQKAVYGCPLTADCRLLPAFAPSSNLHPPTPSIDFSRREPVT